MNTTMIRVLRREANAAPQKPHIKPFRADAGELIWICSSDRSHDGGCLGVTQGQAYANWHFTQHPQFRRMVLGAQR